MQTMKMFTGQQIYTILLLQTTILLNAVIAIRWEHSEDLNEDFRVLWTINKAVGMLPHQHHHQQQSYSPHLTDITFEVQVRTLGYIGFGFSPDGQRSGSDIVIGWVDHGRTYFHVSQFSFIFPFFLVSFCLAVVHAIFSLFFVIVCTFSIYLLSRKVRHLNFFRVSSNGINGALFVQTITITNITAINDHFRYGMIQTFIDCFSAHIDKMNSNTI